MNLITLDFETYYASGYSLGRGKLTTEEYINDDRFQVVGVSVKVNDEKVEWFTGNYEDTKTYLRKLDIPNSALLAHNTLFDGAITNLANLLSEIHSPLLGLDFGSLEESLNVSSSIEFLYINQSLWKLIAKKESKST